MNLVGRQSERKLIDDCIADDKSHFIAIYGRRRVGKTFLIRQHFSNEFDFYVTGLAQGNKAAQLANFHYALIKGETEVPATPTTWLEAFNYLIQKLEKVRDRQRVVFIDELPWMDTPRSGFISGLEYFWNSWASAQSNVLLIGCGSAASWMINKLINNKGGLYNRVTRRVKLKPFTLYETEQFLKVKKYKIDRYQIVQLYMVFGGIPFYLDRIDRNISVAQNINQLCFAAEAPFKTEYQILFRSLFDSADIHLEIVEALLSKRIGLSKKQLVTKMSIKDGGGLKRALSELESSDFIRKYQTFGKSKRDSIYQLTDPLVLFYHRHIKKATSTDYWLSQLNTPKVNTWQGNAYEMICLLHVDQIKQALGIAGVNTEVSAWWGAEAQIDLIIDRQDRVINIIEVKFSISEYEITKKSDKTLRTKLAAFLKYAKTNKAIWMTMITTYGLKFNAYAGSVQRVLSLDDLFSNNKHR